MTFFNALSLFNYGLVLIYGLFLSEEIAGGWTTTTQRNLFFISCPVLLLNQILCYVALGIDTTKQLYPLIVHLPLIVILILALKKSIGVAIVSVCTAYLCCQLPHWGGIALTSLTGSPLIGEISYTFFIISWFFLLRYSFTQSAHNAMTYSRRSLLLFGSLPVAYYLFDYATTIYSDALYKGSIVLSELSSTVIIMFYVIFLTAYHVETQKRSKAELQNSLLDSQNKQAQKEMNALRQSQTQTAIYQHDMRHHLNIIDSYLTNGNIQQATQYIHNVRKDIAALSPSHFCENETVNLLCSSFSKKAEKMNVSFRVDARLPKVITIPDTELCAVLSNGLENALNAAATSDIPEKFVEFYCNIRLNKLLVEIKNPYVGEIIMQNGSPVSAKDGHGYGCKSIETIVRKHQGLCTFKAENGIFTLRIILPVNNAQTSA